MVSITQATKRLVKENIMLEDYLSRGLINYISLAEALQPKVSGEVGKKVKVSSIAMALRRYSAFAKKSYLKSFSIKNSELTMKSGLCDFVVYKSPSLFAKLKRLYEITNHGKGETLNIIHGNILVSIITNEKFIPRLKKIFAEEKIFKLEKNLVSLTVQFGENFIYVPGIDFSLIRELAYENINIIEIISSLIEITFIINKKDASKAYNSLESFIKK